VSTLRAESLQIYDAKERLLVRLADAIVSPLSWFRPSPATREVRRLLMLRLERIGDLLMVLDAVQDARATWPDAEIDLVVGEWNAPVAKLIPGVTRVIVASAPWLARDDRPDSWSTLVSAARRWRRHRYDLVVNFEPDIRSNALAWLTAAPRRVGYWTGGGGSLLTDAAAFDPASHVGVNARNLVARAAGAKYQQAARGPDQNVTLPAESVARADAVLAGASRPLIGVHASGGRMSKQWHVDRFGAVARALALGHGATIVLTGSTGDRALVDAVRGHLEGVPVVDLSGSLDLPTLGAVLSRLNVFVTGDTGPMHLASVLGVPTVALFGPSDPARYGPRGGHHRVLRVSLPCSPCGQVRLPPERCRGHVPECMDGISVDAVVRAAEELLAIRNKIGPA
jgi:ADP-heptose:LPS heptosyltransferase